MRGLLGRRRLVVLLAVLLGLSVAFGVVSYVWLLAGLPSLGDLPGMAAAPSSKVYDRHGRLLFEMPPPYTGSHSPVPLSEVPQTLRQAIIATEDATFYRNPGVDAWAIVRALWINIQGGEVLSGGSTITQQLARTLLLSPEERYERTLSRKLREAVLAWRLARTHSKDEILELYLNEIYFGNMAYGVEAAAQAYFGKGVNDLDLAECAMLAGLPQAPAVYNPLENLPQAKSRQAVVLDLMVKQGYLTAEDASAAKAEKLYFASAPFSIRAPHFVMYVRGQLEQELGIARLEEGGLKIYTTLDLDLSETARDVIRYRLDRLATCNGHPQDCPPGGSNVRNAALVALDPYTGEILTMIGSPDYFSQRIDGAVNGATALRQPGSAIKPITYAAAFQGGELTPATMMLDLRTSFITKEGTPYVPLNYNLQFRGPVRLREALASSYNLVAVKVLDTVGVEAMTNLGRRLGITTLDDPDRLGLSVTLGGGEVRLLELTAAYAAFANGGYAIEPIAILRVQDADGQVLFASSSATDTTQREQTLDERVAYLITDILSDDWARVPSFGEGSVLSLSRAAAVKTGTTTDFRDNWTMGYTPDLVIGVWSGNADNEPMHEVSGISGAAPIWHDVMESALNGQPVRDFQRPEGLVEVEICALSGLRAGQDCPHPVTELFVDGTQPTETCTVHQRIALDQATGLRATGETPDDRIVQQVFTVLPAEAQEWARLQGIPAIPQPAAVGQPQAAALPSAVEGLQLVMTSPDEGAVYRLDPVLPREAQRIAVSARPGTAILLQQVTLLVDGQVLARIQTPPYHAFWHLERGMHVFSAIAEKSQGEQTESNQVWVQVR